MKKKMVCYIVMAALMLSLLVGCSSEKISDSTPESVAYSSYSDVKIGICIYQLADNFMSLFSNELVSYLVSKGFSRDNIILLGSANNDSVQLSQVEELIAGGAKALIINPVNSSVAHSITDLAASHNIPLVYINREPSGDEENRWESYQLDVCYVVCDARQSGIYQGELLLTLGNKALDRNGDGKIQYFMIEGAPENIDAGYRTLYSVSTLKNADLQLDCLLDEVGNWDCATAQLIVRKGIKEGLIPEVIICNNDAMALGAIEAVEQAGLKPGEDVYVVGVDALPEAIEMVQEGKLLGTVYNDYVLQSHLAADAAINYLQGNGNEHYIGCDYVKVNRDNAQDIIDAINNKK
ncbi:MAG: substrate-binding domain-containing protein [Butyrivibrio sp.]|uniref:substrate-binding domain-containing protein n=1 Tax=Butyrivibrio sp. TaxID=28121 RepID=UPI0025C57E3E|nr:substrate-binding domain-containing protein [Butyrivibrio sp.]MBQ6588999.1 substrate-binding domain-containing protein [Butyrivibrio sp.]